MEIKWIKLSTDVFNNRKIRQIESMPDGDAIVVIWLKLLILAGEVNDGGNVYFTRDLPYTDQLLATQFNRPLATVQLALRTFEQFGMISIVDDIIMVTNWEKYQSIDKMTEIREYNRLAQQKSRANRKALLSQNNDVNDMSMTSQDCQGTDIDIDIDKDNIFIYSDSNESDPPKKAKKRFEKPSVEEIQTEIDAKGYKVNAEVFYNYYENVGWRVGSAKTVMKNWRLALANWNIKEQQRTNNNSYSKRTRVSDINERTYKKGEIDQDLNDPTMIDWP